MRYLVLFLVIFLPGCMAYNIASVGSYVATGKGIPDHAGSAVTGGDCNTVKHLWNGQYVCEMPVVYNRHGF